MSEHITTPDELDALPVGSVILDGSGWTIAWVKGRTHWHSTHPNVTAERPALHATVLFRPDAPTPTTAERCDDLTRSPRGLLRCNLPAGHFDADPTDLHRVDVNGPVEPTSAGDDQRYLAADLANAREAGRAYKRLYEEAVAGTTDYAKSGCIAAAKENTDV